MYLDEAFAAVPQLVPGNFDRFQRHIDPEWIEDALIATGTATIRRRPLPAEQTLRLVIGMTLMRNKSIKRVVALLNVALPPSQEPRGAQRTDPSPQAAW